MWGRTPAAWNCTCGTPRVGLVTSTIGQGTVAVPPLGLELSLDEIYAGL